MTKQLLFSLFFLLCSTTSAIEFSEFQTPPDSARPWTYWFVMDGNLDKAGITADFEAMKKAGIGGIIFMEVNIGVPRGKVDFMSQTWLEYISFAIHEAERLGLQVTINSGPGWTGSGGPWIKPENSMLHLVASEKNVKGPVKLNEQLPKPEPRKPYFGEGALPPDQEKARKEWFKDVKVLAFPVVAKIERIKDIDEKALVYRAPYSSAPGVKPRIAEVNTSGSQNGIDAGKIIDITDKLAADGTLNWDVPDGDWTILRFAATTTGANTRPAPQPGLGLEASKMDREFFDIHYDNYIGKLFKTLGKRQTDGKAGLCYFHIDSWEMGSQNFSFQFLDEFKKQRGYDPVPYLAVYHGLVVGNSELSERFLWDVRQTAQELIILNHGVYLKELAHKNGLKLSVEPYDMMPCCDMAFGSVADLPMCEFWSEGYGFDSVYSCFEATSIAHTHGIPLVGAEAFTSSFDKWRQNPKSMKQQGDWAFCVGINRITFHRFQHQPEPARSPGFSMGIHGVHWERTQTWWDLVLPYHQYLARCQSVLQQGTTVSDILYLLPEGAPQVFTPPSSALLISGTLKDKRGHQFDGCDPGTLIERAAVKDGKIVFPNGTEYQVLVLPKVETMTLPLLKKIEQLVDAGATVIGNPPKKSPSLQDYPKVDEEIQTLAKTVFAQKNVIQLPVAKDELYPSYEETVNILSASGIVPDLVSPNEAIRFTHRKIGDADYYFIANRNAEPFSSDIAFRVTGKNTTAWNPMTGQRYRTPPVKKAGSQSTIPIDLEGYESVFVVFDKQQPEAQTGILPVWEKIETKTVLKLDNDWTVSFDKKWKAPEKITMAKLSDWSTSSDEGIKYYSGIATYKKDFDISDASGNLFLELGEVEVIARVKLNGKDIGTRWVAPYRFDITSFVKEGENDLEIEVANLWANRLIGDAKLPASERLTWSTWGDAYKATDTLLPSGLLGPVRIQKEW
ncbi:hypothetical protein FACS189419_09040 [Planctomycetales bacterium]|nr:hypothetical protein FACS189419_09040 [Planctomycetales bacterium]